MPSLDEFFRRQQEHIDTIGWAVTAVVPDPGETDSPFAYTVGLTERDLPELVIAGLDPLIAHELLNDMARRVYSGAQSLTHGQRVDDLLVGYDAVIVEGPATEALHPGAAYARYGNDRVYLQQIVWPDKHGRFPWDYGYAYPAHVQPLLTHP
ncbi:DUF4262 domain-containing protein [Micromonospora sagamiensis]|uniref:Uncharacterized protein DUF4262 n=1 Tax=Micromonospora sagamiensis TaxID=47875 RepID=A0A562WS61_9ACTN|nr:DUF4262 domain-containing protein [Micromonospora sagamiensis]TWJ32254.1 uncharacterized protein DUF4262 [Micromonospora sagamiensis]BCL14684.1 hypothetical protein GCM10017556_24230 [Micromonospora sagamiensis]